MATALAPSPAALGSFAVLQTSSISLRKISVSSRLAKRQMSVRAEAETPGGAAPAKETTPPSTSASTPATLPIEPVRLPQGSTQPVFKGGRAQEAINGRAAMLGFVAALGAELASGLSVWQQVTLNGDYPPGFPLLLIPTSIAAIVIGSFAPRVFGQKDNGLDTAPSAFGPFTPFAETVNGRAAMVGIVALIAVEAAKGSALFR